METTATTKERVFAFTAIHIGGEIRMDILIIITIAISISSVVANILLLWIVVKLYTEIFKQKQIDSNFSKAIKGDSHDK
jgi:hypothetical protein